jgi:hypothetical protein
MHTTTPADATVGAATPLRQKYGAFNTPGRYMAHVALYPDDMNIARAAIDAIAQLTGQRPSLSVLLRAGISAMTEDVKQVKAEKAKRPDENGKFMTQLMWSLARAAQLKPGTSSRSR